MNDSKSYKKAFDYSIRLLSLRDYSIYKMKQKLIQRKFENEDIQIVIEKLIGYKYLRDEEFTKIRIKQLVVRGYADNYIIQKLKFEQLPITQVSISSLRTDQGLDINGQIKYLISKKLRYKDIPIQYDEKMKLKRKIVNFLISKGHNFCDFNAQLSEFFT